MKQFTTKYRYITHTVYYSTTVRPSAHLGPCELSIYLPQLLGTDLFVLCRLYGQNRHPITSQKCGLDEDMEDDSWT